MSFLSVSNVKFAGCAVTLGQNRHVIDDEPKYYENNKLRLQRLKNTIGMGSRYVASQGTTTSDLCYNATQRLLEALHCTSKDIGAIISVTQTPDLALPGNAYVLHKRLKLPRSASAHDLSMGCSGFVYGLSVAALMVEHGIQNVLLVAGDTLSRMVDAEDRATAPLFGDAGSATLIQYSPKVPKTYFLLGADGTGSDIIHAPGENGYFSMNGYEVFQFSMSIQPEILKELLKHSNKQQKEIDYFIFHQANRYIVTTIASKAGISEDRAPSDIFSKYGNLNSASIPAVLCGSLSKKLRSTISKVVLQGFGVGLSWAGALITLDQPVCLPPVVLGTHNE